MFWVSIFRLCTRTREARRRCYLPVTYEPSELSTPKIFVIVSHNYLKHVE
ncbi:unnamed protein product [Amoebophrya sp. A25]|nr:unnamed protein product [Amoebophrya sp. A25]|eukprot:GSA25T00004154001.1